MWRRRRAHLHSKRQHRWTSVSKDPAYGLILNEALLSTTPDTLLAVLKMGTVSTNVFLRRIQNFALDMGWLPWPILKRKQFPKVRFRPKRGITEEEHQKIIQAEKTWSAGTFTNCAGCWAAPRAISPI